MKLQARCSAQPRPVVSPEPPGVELSALARRHGWEAGSWQDELLRAADGAGAPDGKVSVAEVDAYLANPEDLRFLTSGRLVETRRQVAATGGTQAVDGFEPGWRRGLAARADAAGAADGFVTSAELDAYCARLKAGLAADSRWLPEQREAVLDSKLAELSGEVDHLRPAGGTPTGTQRALDYMRVASNDVTRAPDWVSYRLSAADRAIQDDVSRQGLRFRPDAGGPSVPVTQDEYTAMNGRLPPGAARFDRGHMREAESAVDVASMRESFLTSNIAPQYANVNQGAWRYLEEAVRELTEASDGHATVFTGNLYLDASGRPLAPEDVALQQTKDGRALGIPTHSYKAILLERADGTQKAFAFIVPNRPDVGRKLTEVTRQLREERWRVDVDTLESLTGYDFFSQLEAGVQRRLEADSTSGTDFLDPRRDRLASLFMGASAPQGMARLSMK